MTESLPTATTTTRAPNEPVEPTGEIARKNVMLALILVGVVILVVAGAVAISLIYLHYD
jgi:hypothetical protein